MLKRQKSILPFKKEKHIFFNIYSVVIAAADLCVVTVLGAVTGIAIGAVTVLSAVTGKVTGAVTGLAAVTT